MDRGTAYCGQDALPGHAHRLTRRGPGLPHADRLSPDPFLSQSSSTLPLAASTLREMGFLHTVALDGGMKAWREAGYPLETGPAMARAAPAAG